MPGTYCETQNEKYVFPFCEISGIAIIFPSSHLFQHTKIEPGYQGSCYDHITQKNYRTSPVKLVGAVRKRGL